MADWTPDAREMSQRGTDALSAPEDPFDLKSFELLDDIYNAVSSTATHASLLRNVQNKMSCPMSASGSEGCRALQVNDYTAHGMDAFEE